MSRDRGLLHRDVPEKTIPQKVVPVRSLLFLVRLRIVTEEVSGCSSTKLFVDFNFVQDSNGSIARASNPHSMILI